MHSLQNYNFSLYCLFYIRILLKRLLPYNCVLQGIEREFTTADTVAMARFLLPGLNRFKLDTVAKAVGVSLENHHRAVDDAGCTAEFS